jgi:hypothetical protein
VTDWSPALLAEFRSLERARLGAPLTPEELAGWLRAVERRNRAHAGDEGEDPETARSGAGLLGRSVAVAGTGVRLELPTIAARIRIGEAERERDAERWTDGECLHWTAYCLAHARDRAALDRLATPADGRAVVREWAAGALTCSEADVETAVAALLEGVFPEEDADPGGATAPDWPGLIQALRGRCGGTSQYWLHAVSWPHAAWMLRAAVREARRRQRALAEAMGRAAAMDPDDPAVRAIGQYRELRRRLQEMPGMKRETVTLSDGRTIEVRELTYGELRRIQAEGDALPLEWPLLEQFRGREAELDALGVSDVRQAAERVYALSFEGGKPAVSDGGGETDVPRAPGQQQQGQQDGRVEHGQDGQ